MRATITLAGGAATALLASVVAAPPHDPAQVAEAQAQHREAGVEYRGELYPDPETGCIELPEEPGSPPRLWPPREEADDAADVVVRRELPDAPGGLPPRGPEAEPWSEQEFDLYARPWPLCDAPDVSVVVTEDDLTVTETPDTTGR